MPDFFFELRVVSTSCTTCVQAPGEGRGTKGPQAGQTVPGPQLHPRFAPPIPTQGLPLCSHAWTPTLRSDPPTGLSPCPTFPHSCLGNMPAHWGPELSGGQKSQEGVDPTGPRGRKPACPQLCSGQEKLSLPQLIPTSAGRAAGPGAGGQGMGMGLPANPAQHPSGFVPLVSRVAHVI